MVEILSTGSQGKPSSEGYAESYTDQRKQFSHSPYPANSTLLFFFFLSADIAIFFFLNYLHGFTNCNQHLDSSGFS